MHDRAYYDAKLSEIQKRKARCLADYNALEGAEQFCRQALAELDAPPLDPDKGIPLEQLLPGATIEGVN